MKISPKVLAQIVEAELAALYEEKQRAERAEYARLKAEYGSSVGPTGEPKYPVKTGMDKLSANQIHLGGRALRAFATAIKKQKALALVNHACDMGWTPDNLWSLANQLQEIAKRETEAE